MRSLRLFLLLLPVLFLGVSSCCEEDPFIPTPRDTPGGDVDRTRAAFVRIIHAAATAPGAVVVIDNKEIFGGAVQQYLFFQTGANAAKYYPVDTASKRISFRAAGGELASLADMALEKGAFYTFYLHGDQTGFGVLRTRDTVSPKPGTGRVKLRAVNLSPGSRSIDIHLEENGPAIVTDLAYGAVKEYSVINRAAGSSGLYIKDAATKDPLFSIPPPYVVLPADAILTLVMTGKLEPQGEDPMLSFSVFPEDFQAPNDSLFGSPPFRLNFAAVRFANLVPMRDTSLSVSFLDSTLSNNYYILNQHFRRNLLGQPEALVRVSPLGNSRALGMHKMRGYMLLGTLLTTRYPYRIEIGIGDAHDPQAQPVLVDTLPARGGGFEFKVTPNKRYTIVAYGPKVVGQARSLILSDNTRAPSNPGLTTFRFFHGGFGAGTQDRRLKVRINGVESPLMGYGENPNGATQAAETGSGATTIELLDENGTLLHTEILDESMTAGEAYTIFLSRGAFGESLVLTQVSEALDLVY